MSQTMRQVGIFAAVAPAFQQLRLTDTAVGDFDQDLTGIECRNFQLGQDQWFSSFD